MPVTSRHTLDAAGMTLIELAIVMGIVSVLLALVFGLSRHVNEAAKIRRAQAELAQWHESLNRWFLQFGEYPAYAVDAAGNLQPLLDPDKPARNLSNIVAQASVPLFRPDNGTVSNITFQAFLTHPHLTFNDPWDTPYLYDCDPGGRSYTLFSCGPDSRTLWRGIGSPLDALDDIYLER